MMLLNLMMSLKLKLLKHLIELAFLDMNCLRYWKVMLWMEKYLETFLPVRIEMVLCKLKENFLNARMKCDPKFATSPIFVTDKDY